MSDSLYMIGFEKDPVGLKGFLEKRGYSLIEERGDCSTYGNGVLEIFHLTADSEFPDWEGAGFNVSSEIRFMYDRKEIDSWVALEEISIAIAKEFDGVLYDIDSDDFFSEDEM